MSIDYFRSANTVGHGLVSLTEVLECNSIWILRKGSKTIFATDKQQTPLESIAENMHTVACIMH